MDQLVRRLQGVLEALHRYVMMDFDIRAEAAEAGAASPGIGRRLSLPLQTPGRVAVRAMVPRADTVA